MNKMYSAFWALTLLVAFTLILPTGIYAQQDPNYNQDQGQKITIIGQLKVVEKDPQGRPSVLEIMEQGQQGQQGQLRTFKIAREGKGEELFSMSGKTGLVKVTGTLHGNDTLYITDYEFMNKNYETPERTKPKQPERRPDSPKTDEHLSKQMQDPTPREDYKGDPNDSNKPFGSEYGFTQKEEYRKAFEKKLEDCRQQIIDLEKKVSTADQDVRESVRGKIDDCSDMINDLHKKADDIPSIKQDNWSSYQKDVQEKLAKFDKTYNEALDKLGYKK